MIHCRGEIHRRRALAGLTSTTIATCLPGTSRAATWPTQWQSDAILFHADFVPPTRDRIDVESSRLCHEVPVQLGLPRPEELIHVYLFHDRMTFEKYVRHYFPTAPMRRALFIK